MGGQYLQGFFHHHFSIAFAAFLLPDLRALAVEQFRCPVLLPQILQGMLMGQKVAPRSDLVDDI